MAEKEGSRRKYLTLAAVNPADGTATEVLVSYDRMQAVGRRSLGQAKECGYLVPKVLQEPTAVFEGLREDEDEDRRGVGWRCYCSVPDRAYRVDGTERSPYPYSLLGVCERGAGSVQLAVGNGRRRRPQTAAEPPDTIQDEAAMTVTSNEEFARRMTLLARFRPSSSSRRRPTILTAIALSFLPKPICSTRSGSTTWLPCITATRRMKSSAR